PGRDLDPAGEATVPLEPLVEPRRRAREQREEGRLVDDPGVERRRLEEERERLAAGERVELAEASGGPVEELAAERVGSLVVEQLAQPGRQVALQPGEVGAPDGGVLVRAG